MTWNYRIVKTLAGHFALHEVYYNDAGEATGMTADPATFMASDDPEDGAAAVIASLAMATDGAKRLPVFVEPEVWATWDDEAA